jgi:HEAT repeat protein
LGDKAVPALALLLIERDPDIVKGARAALDTIDGDPIPHLILYLRNDVIDSPMAASRGLGRLPDDGDYPIEILGRALEDNSVNVRIFASRTLSKIGRGAVEALPYLIEGLKDDELIVRRAAVRSIALIGEDASDAVPDLISALGDDDVRVIRTAAVALGAVGPDAGEAIPHLVKMLGHEDARAAKMASIALAKIGRDSIQYLIEALTDSRSEVRFYAAEGLSFMGNNAFIAVPDIERALANEKSDWVRLGMEKALKRIKEGLAIDESTNELLVICDL